MNEIVNDVLPILHTLLSGFVATLIFYWLADAIKPTQFERVIQALFCTGLVKLSVDGLEWMFLYLGRWYSIGHWTAETGNIWSIAVAVSIGLALAFASQQDALYRFARRLKLTSKASIGEWRYAFSRNLDRWVVLHMRDGRRLTGYPDVWPSDPQCGHFLMGSPAWLVDGDLVEVQGIAQLLVANADVQWIEFLALETETNDE
ncbi:hypothetical protein SAMN04490182_2425 [Pseudomonas cedrina]|uniref:Uncharacterized protein n=2 Tax=Pseudomonas cedrina TaxID=651740 RepID=A0A1V2K1B9_PSECE|nr:DUF6338 family protein [Pseudomonas cedrina]ONH51165.1 hypothetical protein BLL36_22605 [Pseudomonas cedrina subsp. cedrina]SDS79982.1 hypothetical protein SAMN04490182_2425 [Pseudomonas cedrina]